MAGGTGSRFWPVSRADFPKQFIDFLGSGKTLIQQTMERFTHIVPAENIFIITSGEYVDLTRKQLPLLPPENILSEPARKNTAACLAYISFKLQQADPEATLIAVPADHLIRDADSFFMVCTHAVQFASQNDALVTLGIKPTNPNTGYGYIRYKNATVAPLVYPVASFTEKPDFEHAKAFLVSGDYLWNAGIFVWRNSIFLKALRQHLPALYELFAGHYLSWNTDAEAGALSVIYAQCDNISVDVGIMEKAANVFVIPASFGWSDLGTWNSVWEQQEKDAQGNAVSGNRVMLMGTEQCVVHSENGKLLVLQGLDNYIVVNTKDALLVCKKEQEQVIKEYVAAVKEQYGALFI